MMDGLGQSSHSMLRNLVLIYRLQKQGFHRTCTFFLQITCLELTFCLTEAQHVLLFDLWTSKESFPTLPTMVQAALNATNICFEAVGEVELLCAVAARAQHMMDAGKQPDFANLAALSAAGSVSTYAQVCPVLWGWPPMGSNQVPEYFFHGGQICQLGKGILSSCDRSRVFQHKHVPTAETWITLLQFDSTQGKDSRWFCQAAEQI